MPRRQVHEEERVDRILVLNDKGIAEQGTHEQLLAACGIYAGLYSVQVSL